MRGNIAELLIEIDEFRLRACEASGYVRKRPSLTAAFLGSAAVRDRFK